MPSLGQTMRLLPLEQSPKWHNQTIVRPMMDFVTPNRVKELKTLPIPIAAPPNAIVAAPDPINFALSKQAKQSKIV